MSEKLSEIYEKLSEESKAILKNKGGKHLVKHLNDKYRLGQPEISDKEYDLLMLNFGIDDGELMDDVVAKVHPKVKLKNQMGSLKKIKTFQEFVDWIKSKGVAGHALVVATPKFDGMSIQTVEYNSSFFEACTRGDGEIGRLVTKVLDKSCIKAVMNGEYYGEIMMRKSVFHSKKFLRKDGTPYSNIRNLIPSIFSDPEPNQEILDNIVYVRYGSYGDYGSKVNLLNIISEYQRDNVFFHVRRVDEITQEWLDEVYQNFATGLDFEIDGLVLEFDSVALRTAFGKETNSNNPAWARAYKPSDVGDNGQTKVKKINKFLNKDGEFKPVLEIEPVELNGAVITNVYVDNERFLFDYGIGVGSNIEITRSGGIIPRVVAVEGFKVLSLDKKGKEVVAKQRKYFGGNLDGYKELFMLDKLPNNYIPIDCSWDQTYTEKVVNDADSNPEVKLQRIIFFFETIGVENVSDKTFEDLYKRGYDTIEKILNINPDEMATWEGYGFRKAQIIYDSINSKTQGVDIVTLMHASNCFTGMGSDKIKLIMNDFKKAGRGETLDVSYLVEIDGIAAITAEIFVKGIRKFREEFYTEEMKFLIPTREEQPKEKPIVIGNKCEGWIVCFTKFRDKGLEKAIEENGGTATDKWNNSVTHLCIKDASVNSSKVDKARKAGKTIITQAEMENYLKTHNSNGKENNNSEALF